jgi:peptide/nickel transport system substrate-binding protein
VVAFIAASLAGRIGAGANALRNVALCDRRIGQYARSEHSGSTREAFAVSLSTYDRLVSFGRKQLNGKWVFDLGKITGELAESYEVSPDGLKMTFACARTPNSRTARRSRRKTSNGRSTGSSRRRFSARRSSHGLDDVGRSVQGDRSPDHRGDAAEAGQAGASQSRHRLSDHLQLQGRQGTCDGGRSLGTGMVEGEHGRQRRLQDRDLQAGRTGHHGAQRGLESRYADKSAFFKRVIVQSVPEPATRANLVERGDADIVVDLQASDVQSLEAKGKLKVISTPQYNSVTFVSMNNQIPPFDNVNVRRAIAFALPYDDMFKAALFGRGSPLFGATWADGKPTSGAYPIPQPVKLDLEKAKEYLKAAGMPDGFSTTFSFNVGQASTAEPMAALVKESLAKIGIKVDIQKLPDAQMSTQINEKKLPFFTEGIVAWLPSTDYFYRNFYTGNQRWNYSSINNPELAEIAQKARFEPDAAKYEEDGVKLNAIHFSELPQIPLWQPSQDAVMASSVEGYTYQFHRQVDYRDLNRK